MPEQRRIFGDRAEALAVAHLQKRGYRILEKNFRNRMGEIDIIARHRGSIVFVEVKARKSLRYGSPKSAVSPKKQRRISLVALSYLKETRQTEQSARFDVVSMVFSMDTGKPDIELIQNAFDLEYGC